MWNSGHSKFILTPIIGILQDTVNACAGIGEGIETQSLGEYVLQTTFLKMTGASEQKLKCICWEMATNDYDYRYRYLKKNYGECSSYNDKCSIFKDLKDSISKMDTSFNVNRLFEDIDISSKKTSYINRKIDEERMRKEEKKKRPITDDEFNALRENIKAHYRDNGFDQEEKTCLCREVLSEKICHDVNEIVGNSLLAKWDQHKYRDYLTKWNDFSRCDYVKGNSLFNNELQSLYTDVVYAHRNRCAHNLASYQSNLPTLKTLEGENFVYDNYYFRFSVLILLDEIFIRLYKLYQITLMTRLL